MSPPSGKPSSVPYQQSTLVRLLVIPLGIIYRLWTASIRIDFHDEDGRKVMKRCQESVVFILWHNRLFIAGEWHRRFRKDKMCYGLISGSKDGSWLETFYGWAGIRAIRGSRNRRGAQAARDLVRVIRNGHDIGITPDGSRGPKYKVKPGALWVARTSRAPAALLSFSYGLSVRLSSWDEFIIPLPFSRIRAQMQILSYEELFENRDLDQATQRVEQRLLQMTND